MKKSPQLILLAVVCLLQGVSHAIASQNEHEQHGTHEHGKALLNLVQEGNELEIEIRSPSINVVGFEHQPKTDPQKKTAQEATQTLKAANQVFALPASAGCRLEHSKVLAFRAEGEHDDHHKEEHASGHDDHHKEEHASEHDDHHNEEHEATHSEFHLEYEFSCNTPENLKSVGVNLFKLFPGFEEIEAQIITSSGQTAQELTKGQSTINL